MGREGGRRRETDPQNRKKVATPRGPEISNKTAEKMRARRRGYKRHPRSQAKARYTQEIEGGRKKMRITFREGRQAAAAAARA